MNVAIEELSMVRKVHDLPDGRAGAFRHHPVDDAFAFGHPGSWKTHAKLPSKDNLHKCNSCTNIAAIKQTTSGFSRKLAPV
jgi:hypothetical protein